MDELLLRVEADEHVNGGLEHFRDDVAKRIDKLLGVRTKAEVVARGTLPRTDFKARRIIDDRAVFREMNAQIENLGRDA